MMKYLIIIIFTMATSFVANAQSARQLLAGETFTRFNESPVNFMIKDFSANPVEGFARLSIKKSILIADVGYLQSKFYLRDAEVSYTSTGELELNITNRYIDKIKIIYVSTESGWRMSYIRLLQSGSRHLRTWLSWYECEED